jgi:hypothetical protein
MNPNTATIITLSGGLFIGIVTGLILKRQGYSFLKYSITGFLAGAGILGVILKIINDYL